MTTPRPLALDLFCGAGGVSAGLVEAGFDVVGVDSKAQPNYPFPFVQMDALEALKLAEQGRFAFVWASPPCQRYTHAVPATHRHLHPDLVGPTREALREYGAPYIIENVPPAPLCPETSFTLCGAMFGLRVLKHRKFEPCALLRKIEHLVHVPHAGSVLTGEYVTCAGRGVQLWTINKREERGLPRIFPGEMKVETWRQAQGIPHKMTRQELCNAMPPAFSRWIGLQVLHVLKLGAFA